MIVYKGEEYFKYKTTKWTKHYASKSRKLIFNKVYEFEDTYVARNYCKENFKVNILN